MEDNSGEIKRTSSGAPLPPPIAFGNGRSGSGASAAAAASGNEQQANFLPSASTSAAAMATSASPSRSASAALNGYSSDDCAGSGSRSARLRAVRAGRSQPFFIGVAGEFFLCFGEKKKER